MPTPELPSLTHVALTVRDLLVSVPWYEALLEAKPVLDGDTDPDFHHTVYLIGIALEFFAPPA
jgi:glyoxylase I family protein